MKKRIKVVQGMLSLYGIHTRVEMDEFDTDKDRAYLIGNLTANVIDACRAREITYEQSGGRVYLS